MRSRTGNVGLDKDRAKVGRVELLGPGGVRTNLAELRGEGTLHVDGKVETRRDLVQVDNTLALRLGKDEWIRQGVR